MAKCNIPGENNYPCPPPLPGHTIFTVKQGGGCRNGPAEFAVFFKGILFEMQVSCLFCFLACCFCMCFTWVFLFFAFCLGKMQFFWKAQKDLFFCARTCANSPWNILFTRHDSKPFFRQGFASPPRTPPLKPNASSTEQHVLFIIHQTTSSWFAIHNERH